MIRLGQKVRDVVTGATGIVICRTEWLNGCVRVTIQPPAKKDGSVPETVTVDEEQLAVVTHKSIALPGRSPVQTGGGRPDPAPRKDPVR